MGGRSGMSSIPGSCFRNTCELLSVLCYVVALANMAIADVIALGQLAPMVLLLGVAVVFRDRIGWTRSILIALGFIGALLVAQPGANGVSPFAILGLLSAVGTAFRDLIGRKVDPKFRRIVVAYGTLLLVMVGAGVASLLFEHWVTPDGQHLALSRVLRAAAQPRALLHLPGLPHRRDIGRGAVLLYFRGVGCDA